MAATAPKLHILPRHLERFSPGPRPGLRFGIPALDVALPLGVPRGQITVLDAPLGSGGTALLLALAEATLRADEGVVLVDAQRTLAPQAAAHLAALGPFWVIRPRGTESAWWCADVLLRTAAFGLVIVDLAPAPARKVAVRLQRIARDKDCALVVRDSGHSRTAAQPHRTTTPAYGAAVRLCVRASEGLVHITIEKGGAPRAVEVPVATPLPHRLRPHWAVRDRRGVARAGGRTGRRAGR